MQPWMLDDVVVFAFWPSNDPHDPHIGCGMHRTQWFSLQLVLLIPLSLLVGVIAANNLGVVPPTVFVVVTITIGNIFSFRTLRRYSRYSGFYEIDGWGRPLRYLGPEVLPDLNKRWPVRRQTFLRTVGQH